MLQAQKERFDYNLRLRRSFTVGWYLLMFTPLHLVPEKLVILYGCSWNEQRRIKCTVGFILAFKDLIVNS
jgi:hypothetical protein